MIRNIISILLAGLFVFALETYLIPAITPKYQHRVLLIKWKEKVTQQEIDQLNELWKALCHRVGGFESHELNELDSAEKYDHLVILKFESDEAYEKYLNHKDFQRLEDLEHKLVDDYSEYHYWR